MLIARRLVWLGMVLSLAASGCAASSPGPMPTAPATMAPLPSPTTGAVAPRLTPVVTPVNTTSLQASFAAAAKEFGVPESILLAVAYNESLWEQHDGQPSTDGGYGVMHLSDAPDAPTANAVGAADEPFNAASASDTNQHTLQLAARLLGESPDVLRQDPRENVRGGAALLAQYARETVGTVPTNESDWFGAVARYSGSTDAAVALGFADQVYATVRNGASRITTNGQQVSLLAATITPNRGTAEALHLISAKSTSADCPPDLHCDVNEAAARNFNVASRPSDGVAISYIVIHDTEASYDDAIKTFQDSRNITSANYVIRSSDGHVTQMVPVGDVAHHAGNWYFNMHSIGIEHEGFAVQGATWYSEPLYRASAKLVRYLAAEYHVPLDRAHIIGHDNVPGQTPTGQTRMHWDPGPFWDWSHYLDLLGVPITTNNNSSVRGIVTIDPRFSTNQLVVSDCNAEGCRDLPAQPSNFVFLRTEPRPDAPLIDDSALDSLDRGSGHGTTRADDWGDKAVAGEMFFRFARQGDWDGIYFGGQVAWLYDPNGSVTASGRGTLIQPKAGRTSIPVYGGAYPEGLRSSSAIARMPPLQYTIPAGQIYVAAGVVTADYLPPNGTSVVRGSSTYYQIFYNHRLAFVKTSDVDVVPTRQ